MKKTLSIVLYVIIAVALIWLGVWYDNKSSDTATQEQYQAGQAAQQAQNQLVDQLTIKDTIVGTGATVKTGDTVNVLYTGKLDNGTVFDASSLHGNAPFTFTVGAANVIQGWDLGLVGMKVGGTRELTIPPQLGYGDNSPTPAIPNGSTLHFTIQLLSIVTSTPSAQ